MKKGLSANMLVFILLSLIVFFIVLSVSVKISSSVNSDVNKVRQQCKLSALYLSKVNSDSQEYSSFNCNTIYYSSKDVPEKPEEQKKFLADEMFSCWNVFGEGKTGPLFQNSNIRFSIIKGEFSADFYVADKCFVCSVISPPEKGFFIENFLSYLKNNKPVGREYSYYYSFYDSVVDDKNFFVKKKNDGYYSVFSVQGYKSNKPLYTVYLEGKGKQGVGLYTEEEYKNICKGVLFGN